MYFTLQLQGINIANIDTIRYPVEYIYPLYLRTQTRHLSSLSIHIVLGFFHIFDREREPDFIFVSSCHTSVTHTHSYFITAMKISMSSRLSLMYGVNK